MINKIFFKNYKSFKEGQLLELKPITVLIGKNSSGKSAIAKLPTLIEGSLIGDYQDPLVMVNGDVELGAEFRDLIYGREIGSLEFQLFDTPNTLTVEVASGIKENDLPRIRKWILNNSFDLSYNDIKKTYHNEVNEADYRAIFYGFNIDNLTNLEGDRSEDIPYLRNLITLRTNYIGPIRTTPNRTYNVTGNLKSKKIGTQGENAYQILITDHLYNEGILLKQVSNWYNTCFDGWNLEINTQSKPDYKVELSRTSPQFNVNIRDVGQGMSQALPLVVSAFYNKKEKVLTIIEQPELHLHPAAHGNLAELFAMTTIGNPSRFLIETHSQNFVLRLRRMVAEKRFDKSNLAIYSVEYDEDSNTSFLLEIKVDDLGNVNYWPEGVFSETLDETLAIRTAQLDSTKNDN